MNIDSFPDAVLVISPDGTLEAANRRASTLLGPMDDRLGQRAVDVLGLRDAHGGEIALDVLVATDGRTTQCQFVAADGDDVTLGVTGSVDPDGRVVLCGRPVSEHGGIAVVSTVSHELRSPLTSVKGYVALLLSRWDRLDDTAKREMLTQVNTDADRVTRLIGELLDISRLEAGRLVLRRQLIDLGDLATAVVDKVRLGHPELDCRVEIGAVDQVYADPDKVTQVLTNLVENGAKYGSPKGMVVAAETADTMVTVSVTDTGDGIPEDDLPKLFNKFFRRDHGRPDGTGLGLWISRGLVEAHGGRLTATSTVGRGTTFAFTLPLNAFEAVHGAVGGTEE